MSLAQLLINSGANGIVQCLIYNRAGSVIPRFIETKVDVIAFSNYS